MIIARLQGGLGNQLFQYAAGRGLADRSGQDLGLDPRDLDAAGRLGNTPRPYLLDRLQTRAQVLGAWDLLKRGHFHGRLGRFLHRRGLNRGHYIAERGAHYIALSAGPGGAYLDGFFQSWRYLESQRPQLLRDLALRQAPLGRNALLLKRLARQNSVCVHVRRGDYVSLPAANAYHGLMGLDYYRAALKRLGAAARGATYYVFSDEPAWAKKNLPLPGKPVFVDHNSVLEPEQDLRLMAACRHFIIANSSLSWWGAWLGQQAGKKVIAPKQWFKAGPPAPDLGPPAWARL